MIEVWFESGYSSYYPTPNLYVIYDETTESIEYKFYDDGRGKDYSSKKLKDDEIVEIIEFLHNSDNLVRFFNLASNSDPWQNGPHQVSESLKIKVNNKSKTITTGLTCNFSHPFAKISAAHLSSENISCNGKIIAKCPKCGRVYYGITDFLSIIDSSRETGFFCNECHTDLEDQILGNE